MKIKTTKHSFPLNSLLSSKLEVNVKYVSSAKILSLFNTLFLQFFSILAISLILFLMFLFGIKKESLFLIISFITIFVIASLNSKEKVNLVWSIRFAGFLKSNKLVTTQKIENKVQILDSAKIEYGIDDKNNFHIRVFGEGKSYSKKTQELDTELMSFLELPLSDKLITASYTEYIFALTNDDRQTMSEAFETTNVDEYILKLNDIFFWEFLKYPHVLISGGTGSGKTFLLLELILKITELKGEIVIIDPKQSDLSVIGEHYLNRPTATETKEIIDLLKKYTLIMNERYSQILRLKDVIGASITDLKLDPIFIIFDEVAAAMVSADNKEKKEMMNYLTQLILKGRQAGINLILATQRPDADVISANLRDQLSVRIALGNLSKDGQKMVFGNLDRDLLHFSANEKAIGYIQIWGLHQQPQEFRATFWNAEFDYLEKLQELKKK